MSTKKPRKHKGGSCNKKITTKNKHPEGRKSDVLVLPPDLLQKLGINLQDIQSPQHSMIEKNEGSCIQNTELNTEKKYVQNDEQESSILETASLMKASVFLSPTFSSSKSSINFDIESNISETCFEEIIAKTNTIKTDTQNKHFNNKEELKADNLKYVNAHIYDSKESICGDVMQSHISKLTTTGVDNIETVKSSATGLGQKFIHPKADMESNNSKEEDILEIDNIKKSKMNKSFHINAMSTSLSTTLDIEKKIHSKSTKGCKSPPSHHEDRSKRYPDNDNFTTKKTSCEEKNREEPDNSSAYPIEEHISKLDEMCSAPKVCNISDKVIKIGEKELVNNSNNNCSSHENVTLSTKFISDEPILEAKCDENISIQYNSEEDTIAKKVNGNLCLPAASKNQTNIQNNTSSAMSKEENNGYDSYEEVCEVEKIGYKNNNLNEGQNHFEADSSNCAKNPTCLSEQLNIDNMASDSNTPLGKVEEIAFYLSQHRQNSMTKNIKTIESPHNSKLCIQGVEKPGGDMKSFHLNRNIKTYSRYRNQKLSNPTSGSPISYSEYNVDSNIDYINDINLSGTKGLHNFCVCDDFGKFFNYELDNSYEHIHFWEQREAQCSVETLLSIYYGDNNVKDEREENMLCIFEIGDIAKENRQEIPNDSTMNICWNYGNIFEKENNYYQNLSDTNDVECIVSKNEQTPLNKVKRKRVDKTSESESESEKPSAKKTILPNKSGVLYGQKAGDVKECSEILVEVSLAHAELEKEEIIVGPGLVPIKSEKKQIAKLRKRLKTEINAKELLPEGDVGNELTEKLVRQTEQDQVYEVFQVVTEGLQETGQNCVAHLPVLKLVETRQNQGTEVPILQMLGTGENQAVEVPVLKMLGTGQNQEAEVPVLQFEMGQNQMGKVPAKKKQITEVLAIQVKTEKLAADVLVVDVKNGQKQVPVVQTGEKNVTCGVCKTVVQNSLWIEHITKEHNYIAWKYGERSLDFDDEEDIRHYLNNIIKEVGELVCKTCGLKRKFAKSYLKHIKNCQMVEQLDDQPTTPVSIKTEKNDSDNIKNRRVRKERSYRDDTEHTEEVNEENIKKEKSQKVVKEKSRQSEIIKTGEAENITVKCGVCKLDVSNAQWIEHIYKEHDYLAWQEGEPKVDVNDSQQVYDHLFYITKQNDGLTCKKCGLTRRYVKSYLKHINTCDGEMDTLDNTLGFEGAMELSTIDTLILDLSDDKETKCGVCHMDVEAKQWFNHVHKCHAYLAWKEGKPALNLDNEQEVQEYLYFVSKRFNGLICHKCGLNRKYVKMYLAHLESCDSQLPDPSFSNKDTFTCAVCSEEVDPKEWTNHAMTMHYNIAWVLGDYPVDVKNAGVVEKLLKAYQKQIGSFKCKKCGMKRASPMGFYVHIIQCGKTEEEIDQFKIFCELCNSKYLCFYKSQHAIMHREQELSKERKLMHLKKEETQDNASMDSPKTEQNSARRRAAQKALQFIEKSESFAYNCPKCSYGADDEAELGEHACGKLKYKDYSDSEGSAPIESSGDESLDSAVDSSLSDEEARSEPRRRKGDSSSAAAKVPRIPFAVKCAKSYLKQSADDYRDTFLTNGTLYPQWRNCSIELIPDDQIAAYLPTLKESCKVIIGRSDPVTFNMFEAKTCNVLSIFVGGCIQAISWAPPHLDDGNDSFGHFLAVACHNDVDAPRLDFAQTYEYSGLLQLWNFGDLSSTCPEFALGIAHDYGTVWSIDWCPSGARDVFPLEEDNAPEFISNTFLRLGLLAIACSNGSAYILSVPYPSTVKLSEKNVYKLTPVAELRLSRVKRDPCQATSICWSTQNGHGTVMVGYSNGTVAMYNLESDSPLLTEIEDGVNIFYPYQDERLHSSCVTDVKTFPSSVGAGLVSSVSPTGSEAAQLRGSARIHKHLSSISSEFVPHWPSVILSGNEAIVNQAVNELDLWGMGRRIGGVQRCCGCRRCGHVAAYAPPVLKLLTAHPAYTDFNKQSIAVFQMRPLSRKRPKVKNDELQVKLEPLTYHDAIKLYALDFKLIKDLNKESAKQVNRPRELYPERFPLSDVPSMAFYPSQKHHRKLAVATHAGVIFILNDDIAL